MSFINKVLLARIEVTSPYVTYHSSLRVTSPSLFSGVFQLSYFDMLHPLLMNCKFDVHLSSSIALCCMALVSCAFRKWFLITYVDVVFTGYYMVNGLVGESDLSVLSGWQGVAGEVDVWVKFYGTGRVWAGGVGGGCVLERVGCAELGGWKLKGSGGNVGGGAVWGGIGV
ncbi:hypothetical protein Tco_0989829 [Tanacetum coccineum]|uniref:Uncharacterized protein n=1 Tax=Tanacetum coccineum TaxID=301880 RepID=A0ABQ5EUX6_9ASTR